MKRVLIPGVILCGADVAQAVDDKNMYMHVFEEMTVYALSLIHISEPTRP